MNIRANKEVNSFTFVLSNDEMQQIVLPQWNELMNSNAANGFQFEQNNSEAGTEITFFAEGRELLANVMERSDRESALQLFLQFAQLVFTENIEQNFLAMYVAAFYDGARFTFLKPLVPVPQQKIGVLKGFIFGMSNSVAGFDAGLKERLLQACDGAQSVEAFEVATGIILNAPVAAPNAMPAPEKVCPSCARAFPITSNFCPHCGVKLVLKETAAPVPPASAFEEPVQAAPVFETLVEEPADETAVFAEPAFEESVQAASVFETPVEEPAVQEAPVFETPVEEPAVQEEPVFEAPVEEPVEQEAPVVEAPVEEPVVQEAPVVETPVEEPVVQEAPIFEAPAEEIAAQLTETIPEEYVPMKLCPSCARDFPMTSNFCPHCGVQLVVKEITAPAEGPVVQEAPVFETPAEEPVQEAPAFEAPIVPPAQSIPVTPPYEEPDYDDYEETTVLSPAAPSAAHLVRKANNENIYITKTSFTLGKIRDRVDYAVSNNKAVSRYHAEITTIGSDYFIIDKNSTNHTYVNGKMIPATSVQIFDGDEILLANEVFEFHLQ